jgi:hypothetical protein
LQGERKRTRAGRRASARKLDALRSPKLVQVEVSPDLVVLGMPADRRDELVTK